MTIEQLLKRLNKVQKVFEETEYFLENVQELKKKLEEYEANNKEEDK